MAILVSELERWLSRLSSDAEVAIDEGGLNIKRSRFRCLHRDWRGTE